MSSISREQALATLEFDTPRYLFRRFNLLREIKPGTNFVEIGAGNMRLTLELAQSFQSGVAIEYGEQARYLYDCLKDTHFSNINLITGVFEEVAVAGKFDLVIACEVMEHVQDDTTFFKKMLGLVHTGGQIVFSVPAHMKFWSTSDVNVGHFRRYEKSDIHNMMQEHNIQNYKIISYGYPFINIFRLLREAKARREKNIKGNLSKVEQTALSGFTEIPWHYSVSKYIVNRYTMWLPALFSTLFNRLDLSEGYIVVIQR